ncbi:MAG: hypothetical protein VX498_15475, partial [Myxococcota bacterium]|nr:hypothetical protein [Myxococcota bacterium]
GLFLLDWIYNPRIDEAGEIIESDDPADADRAFPKKLRAFAELWTPERAIELGKKLPDRAVQDIEGHQVLMMLGPGGTFDPRFWQSLSLQLGLEGIRAWAAQGKEGGREPADPSSAGSTDAAASDSPPSAVGPGSGSGVLGGEPQTPDDGLTPLARARLQAEQRAADATEEAEAAAPEVTEPEQEGTPVTWSEGSRGPLVFVPQDRYESGWLRDLRRGDVDGLGRAERPGGELLERWIAAGAHFVTELSSVSSLLRDNLPLHKGAWDAAARDEEGGTTLTCQLPRVARVRAICLPSRDDGRSRILVSSDLDLDLSEVVATAG